MDVIEPVKRLAEKVTGVGLPSREATAGCIVDRGAAQSTFVLVKIRFGVRPFELG